MLTSSSLYAQRFGANPAALKWKQVDSPGFRLIFPRVSASAISDDDKYDKFLKKANEIWQVTTGTMRASNIHSS